MFTGLKCRDAKTHIQDLVQKINDSKYPNSWEQLDKMIDKNTKILVLKLN